MAVDTSTTIAGFDTAKPAGGDSRTEADDNFRHVKTVIKNAFPYVAGAVSASDVELSYVDGVTSAIQTQLDAKAPSASPTLTGTPLAPTATAGTNTTQIATTAFAQAAISAVNAASGNFTRTTNNTASFSVAAGQLIAATYTGGAVSVTFPASPTTGQVCGVIFDNGRVDNTIDLGANSVTANGVTISGVVTVNQLGPVVWAWYGDYWRPA